MDDSFFAYLQRLELMAFFSGYPLLYAVIIVFAGSKNPKTGLGNRIIPLLPYAYALVGTLFLGFELRNLYPDYSFENIKNLTLQPWLMLWGLLSILFWIPVFAKKTVFSLLHSLVFFFFLLKDLIKEYSATTTNKNLIKNDMKIYTDSLLLNWGAFALLVLLSLVFTHYKNRFRR